MYAQIHEVGGPGSTSEATLFQQAQAGCRASLNTLMVCHEGLVQAVVRQQVLGDLPLWLLPPCLLPEFSAPQTSRFENPHRGHFRFRAKYMG
jgi:hypothetical protein